MNKLSCGDHERIIAEVHLRSCENFQVSEHSIGKFCRSGDGSRGPDHRARVVGLLAAAEVALRHGLGFLRINAMIFFFSDTARRNAPSNEIENLWAALEKNLAT